MRIKSFHTFVNESDDYNQKENLRNAKGYLRNYINGENWDVYGGVAYYMDEVGEHKKHTTFTNKLRHIDVDVDWVEVVSKDKHDDLQTEIYVKDVKYYTDDGENEFEVVEDDEFVDLFKKAIDKAIKSNEKK